MLQISRPGLRCNITELSRGLKGHVEASAPDAMHWVAEPKQKRRTLLGDRKYILLNSCHGPVQCGTLPTKNVSTRVSGAAIVRWQQTKMC